VSGFRPSPDSSTNQSVKLSATRDRQRSQNAITPHRWACDHWLILSLSLSLARVQKQVSRRMLLDHMKRRSCQPTASGRAYRSPQTRLQLHHVSGLGFRGERCAEALPKPDFSSIMFRSSDDDGLPLEVSNHKTMLCHGRSL